MVGEVKVNIFLQVDTRGAQPLRGTCRALHTPSSLVSAEPPKEDESPRETHAGCPHPEPIQGALPVSSPGACPRNAPQGPLSQNVGGQTGAYPRLLAPPRPGAALGCQARGSQGRSSQLMFCGSQTEAPGCREGTLTEAGTESAQAAQTQTPVLTLPEAGRPRSLFLVGPLSRLAGGLPLAGCSASASAVHLGREPALASLLLLQGHQSYWIRAPP